MSRRRAARLPSRSRGRRVGDGRFFRVELLVASLGLFDATFVVKESTSLGCCSVHVRREVEGRLRRSAIFTACRRRSTALGVDVRHLC
jgi:hypothetical protein